MRRSIPGVTALLVAAVVLVGACSSGDHGAMDMGGGTMDASGSAAAIPADAEFNAADVAFAKDMIPHHGQAVQMADLALATSTNPTILALAEEIKAAQDPEIALMEGWLRAWGQPIPARIQSMDHGDDDMGGMAMSGMVTEDELSRMAEAQGVEFDRMFLEMMIRHHEGAIEMAEDELVDGRYQPTKDLAAAVIAAQRAEIDEMRALLPNVG